MKFPLGAAALFIGAVAAAPVSATPVTVSAGESVIFNFDFAASGATPSGPYDRMSLFPAPSGFDDGDQGVWNFFDLLDGMGRPQETLIRELGLGFIGFTTDNEPGLLDGVFSAKLTVTQGSLTVDPYAFGGVGSQDTDFIYPLDPNGSVPEPSSLALVGLTLGLLGAVQRRQRP